MKQSVCVLASIFIMLAALSSMPAAAQDENHAGLVIIAGDGAVTKACVPFTAESIDGYALLQQAGLDLSVEAAGTGVTVCAIAGEGCAYPQESCFCRCQGTPCVYWSYWLLEKTGWRYANLGASYIQAHDGDVQAWRWAAGTVTAAPEPPAVSFEEICSDGGILARADVGALVTSTGSATTGSATTGSMTTTTNVVRTVTAATTLTKSKGVTAPQTVDTVPPTPAQPDESATAAIAPALGVTVGALLLAPIVGLAVWAIWRRTRQGSR